MKFAFSYCLLTLAAVPALAQDNLASHVHGVSKLQIAAEQAEGNNLQLYIELLAPAADIFGFEHKPVSEEQHETMERGLLLLDDPAHVIAIPEAAGCVLQTKLIEHAMGGGEHGHGDEHAHEKHGDDHGHGDEHAHEKHDDDHGHGDEHAAAVHSDVMARYVFDCASGQSIDQFKVTLFEHFAGVHDVTAELITDRGQTAFDISEDAPTFAVQAWFE